MLCAALLAAGLLSDQQALASPPVSGLATSDFDAKVRAQDDLFRHVNGEWLKKTEIPADRASVGAFEQIHETIQPQLRGLIEEAAAKGSSDAQAHKIGDLYASFMDEAALEKLGAAPVAAELAAIDAVSDRKQLAALMARAIRAGIGMPLDVSIHQDAKDSTRYIADAAQSGLGLPDRDYYLQLDDARFKEVRAKYQDFIAKMLALGGAKDTEASAREVLALETELARAQWTRVENRDPVKTYNRVELAALPKLAPGFDWDGFLKEAGLAGKIDYLVVSQPSYVTGLAQLLESQPLSAWKAYAKLRVLNAYAPYLSKDFVDTRFAFVGTVLRGTPENLPRWKRGVTLVEGSLGEGLGKLYVAQYFPPESKARMEELVANLLTAYKQSIDRLDWMSPATKKQAQIKLAKFTPKIGYPKRWIDYSALEIKRDDLAGNVRRAREFEVNRQLAKLGRAIDRDEWLMTPQTVNAYYNPELNEIVFPASILQPPFFDAKADDAVNYGGIGAVIGHEISHGFDDQGSQYDGDGNLRDWWTKQDRARFNAKTKLLVKQYGAFEPVPGYPVNGELTLGENIADNAGLAIAYKAYKLSLHGKPAPVIDGMSGDERFFYGFAQVWRGKMRDAALIQQLKSDPHAPDEIRANGTVRNHPGFYSTFKLKPGDAMYLPPSGRVTLW
ncbi:MAG TPA: M13-type metalloendopeptidase [Methylibium sp.]